MQMMVPFRQGEGLAGMRTPGFSHPCLHSRITQSPAVPSWGARQRSGGLANVKCLMNFQRIFRCVGGNHLCLHQTFSKGLRPGTKDFVSMVLIALLSNPWMSVWILPDTGPSDSCILCSGWRHEATSPKTQSTRKLFSQRHGLLGIVQWDLSFSQGLESFASPHTDAGRLGWQTRSWGTLTECPVHKHNLQDYRSASSTRWGEGASECFCARDRWEFPKMPRFQGVKKVLDSESMVAQLHANFPVKVDLGVLQDSDCPMTSCKAFMNRGIHMVRFCFCQILGCVCDVIDGIWENPCHVSGACLSVEHHRCKGAGQRCSFFHPLPRGLRMLLLVF